MADQNGGDTLAPPFSVNKTGAWDTPHMNHPGPARAQPGAGTLTAILLAPEQPAPMASGLLCE